MPLMAPLSDLIGISRQTAVLALPTGRRPDQPDSCPPAPPSWAPWRVRPDRLDHWLRFQVRFQLMLVALATAFLLTAYLTGF